MVINIKKAQGTLGRLLAPFLDSVRTDGIASLGILRKSLSESGIKSFRFQAFTLKRFAPLSF